MIVIELVIIAQSQSSSQGPSGNIAIHAPTQAFMKRVTSFGGFRVCVWFSSSAFMVTGGDL